MFGANLGTPAQLSSTQPGTTARVVVTVTQWTLVKFWHPTAGIVVIGDSTDISPTVGGNGISVDNNGTETMLLAPGSNVYAIADGASEVLDYYTQSMAMIPQLFMLLEAMATGQPLGMLRQGTMPFPGQAAMKPFIAGGSRWKGRK